MMENIRAITRIISQLNYILTKKQKKEAVLVLFSMILCSGMELLGVSIIYPFLQLVMDGNSLRSQWYSAWIYELAPDISYSEVLVLLCIAIILIYLVKNGTTLLCRYIQNRYAAAFQRELSTTMLDSFLKRPYEYFLNVNSGLILQYIHGNTAATYSVLLSLFEFVAEMLTVALIGMYLIYTDWVVAIAALLLAGTCFIVIVLAFKKRLKKAGNDMVSAAAEQSKASYQAIMGVKEITVMDRRDCFVKQYETAAREVERITVLYNFISACPDRILEGICIGGFIGIVCLRASAGTELLHFIPVLGTFAMGTFKILPSISKMSSRINTIVYGQTRLSKISEMLREVRQLEKERIEMSIETNNEGDGDNSLVFSDEIEIRNVIWKYQNSKTPVLNDLNMSIKKGEAIALIGASGAGKTTLADVILGLFRPQEGKILMDGIDISSIPHIWCKTIGYVPQSVFLIDDTVKSNIAFGIPEEAIDDEKVWMALEQAQLADFIRRLPDKLDTIVGERGVKFSGGQRQRIAIARALYENPEVLILDEATSALDTETETAVMESIEALLGQKTIIIIAHRLTTIRNCDRVFEIIDGKAVERDKNDVIAKELME